jgi:hypothetical protein
MRYYWVTLYRQGRIVYRGYGGSASQEDVPNMIMRYAQVMGFGVEIELR